MGNIKNKKITRTLIFTGCIISGAFLLMSGVLSPLAGLAHGTAILMYIAELKAKK